MTSYPPGAGPNGAAFGGDVYVPPAVAAGSLVTGPPPATTGQSTPPTAYTQQTQVRMTTSKPPGLNFPYAFFAGPTDRTWLLRRMWVYTPSVCRMTAGNPGDAIHMVLFMTRLDLPSLIGAQPVSIDSMTYLTGTFVRGMAENEPNVPYAIPPGYNLLFSWSAPPSGAVPSVTDQARIEYDEV